MHATLVILALLAGLPAAAAAVEVNSCCACVEDVPLGGPARYCSTNEVGFSQQCLDQGGVPYCAAVPQPGYEFCVSFLAEEVGILCPRPAPAMGSSASGAAVALLMGVAFAALRRRRSGPG